MRLRSLIVCAAAAALAIGAARAHGAVYYVATNGSDGWSGTIGAPWRTPQKAAGTLVAGDTVYVRQGVYTGQVVASNSGSADEWITYAAYSNETPTLDGQGIVPKSLGEGVFTITNRHFIRVEGFRIARSAYAGILAEESSDLVIRRNWTSNTWSSGIAAWNCTNVTIEENRVQLACQGDGDLQECITVSGTLNFDVRGNQVWQRPLETGDGGEGITIKDESIALTKMDPHLLS
jgi:polygalacturonase